jgi:hypothetical protein
VLLRGARGWNLITQDVAGVPGRPARKDGFGSGVASGDFDHDGWPDLAIGTPGKDHVSVLYGSSDGPVDGGRQQLPAPDLGPDAGRYGWSLIARDVDGDKHDDLLVGAPGGTVADPAAGAVHVLFGSERRLVDRDRVLRPPDREVRGFGVRMRCGDVDRDGHADLVEGAPTGARVAGHGTYCAGSPDGPTQCRRLGTGGTSSLGVADINGDGRADIVQGDSGPRDPATGRGTTAGEVRLWLGGPEGPGEARAITQDTPLVPGGSEAGDEFGAVVEAGDVDDDGFADIVVTAVGEDEAAGRITVIRGGREGIASTGHSPFDQDHPDVPGRAAAGREFGSTLAVLELSGDGRVDVAVAVRGERSRSERIMVIEGGQGVFAPDETRTSTLPEMPPSLRVRPGAAIRLARSSGG